MSASGSSHSRKFAPNFRQTLLGKSIRVIAWLLKSQLPTHGFRKVAKKTVASRVCRGTEQLHRQDFAFFSSIDRLVPIDQITPIREAPIPAARLLCRLQIASGGIYCSARERPPGSF